MDSGIGAEAGKNRINLQSVDNFHFPHDDGCTRFFWVTFAFSHFFQKFIEKVFHGVVARLNVEHVLALREDVRRIATA